jgi:two-component system sensor histidine kinase HydH
LPANHAQDPEARTGWTALLLGGVLVLLLAALGLTTHDRLQRTRELMVQSLTYHGTLMVQALEGATRASMRQGAWRTMMLQALVDELVDHPHVLAIAILGPEGNLLAASRHEGNEPGNQEPSDEPLSSLPASLRQQVEARQAVNSFIPGELVVGRRFEPFQRLMRMGHAPPPWASSLDNKPSPEGRPTMPEPPPPGPGADRPPESQASPPQPPQPPHLHGVMGAEHMGMGMMGRGQMQSRLRLGQAYVLVRLSTQAYEEDRQKDLRQALLLAGLIFAAALLVALGLMAATRRRDREVSRLRRQVAEAAHLAAVGRLAGSVAHEVRNPLSALRGLVQYLAKGREPGSKEAEYAEVAVSEVDRLERVVSGLLEYTRPREPRRFPLDLRESLQGTLDLMADDPRAQGVEMALEVDQGLPPVPADPDQVRQVLLNLLVNALEALNGRGWLVIKAQALKGRVEVSVSDSGPGLPPGDPEQVFDPFFSTRERGTGLGLAIARRMAQAHGGDLKAANAPTGGAIFTLTLPLNGAKA